VKESSFCVESFAYIFEHAFVFFINFFVLNFQKPVLIPITICANSCHFKQ